MRNSINLLPASFRRQQMIRKRAIQWCTVVGTVLMVGWGAHWCELQEQNALAQRLETLTLEHQPTQTMLQHLVDMRKRLDELQKQEAVARELDNQRTALALFGVISQAAQNTDGRLRVTKFELTNFQTGDTVQKPGSRDARVGAMVLDGVSLDNPSVAELLDQLQDSGYFSRVELLALKEREGGNGSLRDYQLRCEF